MYSFSEPRYFVDNTDLDIESEWNPHYEDTPVHTPDLEPQSPTLGLLYECAHCLSSHSPSVPCTESNYAFALPDSAAYSYLMPVFVADTSLDSTIIEQNYRKWLVLVTPY